MITIQLAEMGVPLLLAVNMADEARNEGVMPRLELIEERFGVKAVPTVAVRKQGTDRLLPLLAEAVPASAAVHYGNRIEAAISRIEELLPRETPIGKRALALMLLCGDESLTPWLAENVPAQRVREMNAVRNRLTEAVGEDISYRVNQARLAWIDRLLGTMGNGKARPKGFDFAQRWGASRWTRCTGSPSSRRSADGVRIRRGVGAGSSWTFSRARCSRVGSSRGRPGSSTGRFPGPS
jgi:Fe2+ transport system protein B